MLLNQDHKNHIFIGESGSGKSELSVSFAAYLAQNTTDDIDLFDMDQTKTMFRSRNYLADCPYSTVHVHYQEQILDSPLTAPGLSESLANAARYTIIDVGGNIIGTRMIARFSQVISQTAAIAWFIVNPYRPWSCSKEVLHATIRQLAFESRLKHFYFISNPTLGPDTSEAQFIQGHRAVIDMLGAEHISLLSVDRKLLTTAQKIWKGPIFALEPSHSVSCL